jgi:ribosomal protein L14
MKRIDEVVHGQCCETNTMTASETLSGIRAPRVDNASYVRHSTIQRQRGGGLVRFDEGVEEDVILTKDAEPEGRRLLV